MSRFDTASSSCSLLSSSDWPHEEILALIKLYREQHCLWNKDSPDYLNHSAKRQAYELLSDGMGVGIVEVMMTIREIRRCYVQELRKTMDAQSEYVSPCAWFSVIDDFLQEHLNLDEIEFVESALDRQNAQISISSDAKNKIILDICMGKNSSCRRCNGRSISSEGWGDSRIKAARRTKSSPERCAGGGSDAENANSLGERSLASSRSSGTVVRSCDEFDAFAKSVACRLRRLRPELAVTAQLQIQRILQSYESNLDGGDSSKSWGQACRKINEQSSEVITILPAAVAQH